ncbi:glycosyltransferase [Bacillus sp. es.036]|uniref:glycosyltransferase n=1 Tax=Bacillus sp. es.036 TaxID=1761764 RepID=UPI000BF5E0BE|nr:glycosyltransferase family 2 protein [Bacillus sp. es.036]PFG12722.1 glycosyl transferase family 2 [Bacillus sp. es.036]
MKNSISLCMIVKNEEDFISNCLNSVKEVVSEIIIVDTGSTDRTIEIAKQHNATIIEEEWKNDFSLSRNIGLEHANGEWILFLDADEELCSESIEELKKWIVYPDADAYFFRVYNHFGEKGKEASVNPTIRMFQNRPEYRFSGAIHEQIADSIQRFNPEARFVMTSVCVDHYGYQPTIRDQKNKTTRNITLLKEELQSNPNNPFHLYNIGIEYLQLSDFENALRCFKKSRELVDPKVNYTHLLYKCEARCLGALNRIDEAITCCNAGIEAFPEYTDLHHYKGSYFMASGDFPSAKESLTRAIQLSEPKYYHTEAGIGTFSTHYLLGLVNESLSEDNEAIDHYYCSYQYLPTSHRPLYRIFQLLRSTERQNDLLTLLTSKIQLDSKEQRQVILNILLRTHCYSTAEQLLTLWLEENNSSIADQDLWRQIKEECRLLDTSYQNKEKNSPKPLLINEQLSRLFLLQNSSETNLPSDIHPRLDGHSLTSILNTERIARILYSQGFHRAFQQYIEKWKEEHATKEMKFQTHSVLQIVQTLSFNAEHHFDKVLKNHPSFELIRAAKMTLPFEEGLIE